MAGPVHGLVLMTPDRKKRDSLFLRRMIGCAVIIGLAILGLAFPIVI